MTFDASLPGLHGMKGTTDFSKFEPRARRTSTKRVKCLSLPRLLNESKIQHVGYMSVDIEGGEQAFLQHFDFERYRVDVLQVECNSKTICEQTRRLVERKGFRCVMKHRFSYPAGGAGDLVFENVRLFQSPPPPASIDHQSPLSDEKVGHAIRNA